MNVLNAYSTMGGTASAAGYQLEEDHPINNLQEVDDAIAYASEAMEAAARLEEASLNYDGMNKTAARLLNMAVENYIDKFDLRAALEANDVVLYDPSADDSGDQSNNAPAQDEEDGKKEVTRLKKVALYLYAVVERIFKALFDFFTNHKATARRLIPKTKQYIGEADSLTSSLAAQLNIKDRTLMNALHINGAAPANVIDMYSDLATAFEKQHAYSTVAEVVRLVTATKEKNQDRITKEANTLRDKLEAGLKASMKSIDPSTLPIFHEKKSERSNYYATEPMFGQHYIFGAIAKDVAPSGAFRFNCAVRKDTDVGVRVNFFRVLTPDEIRQVCRTALKVCENIVRFSRDEELLKKVLREASFLSTKATDEASVEALRHIANVGQNSYIAHLRFVTSTTQALMRWCAQSIARYEEVKQNG
jgi:hypothetical protein